jgi:hypothetical protein
MCNARKREDSLVMFVFRHARFRREKVRQFSSTNAITQSTTNSNMCFRNPRTRASYSLEELLNLRTLQFLDAETLMLSTVVNEILAHAVQDS